MKIMFKRQNISLLVFEFFLLYSTDSALVSTNNFRLFARISWVIIVIITVYLLIKARFRIKGLIYIGLFGTSVLVSMLHNEGGFNINYVQRIILILCAYLISRHINYREFAITFVLMMKIISIVSLVALLFKPIIANLTFIPELYAGNIAFKSLFFTNVPLHGSIRNYGPLWEPGAFQVYLNIAIIFILWLKDKHKMKDIFLFAVTIITTRSTAGYIILLSIILYYIFNQKDENNSIILLKRLLKFLIVISIVYIFINSPLYKEIFGKVYSLIENPLQKNSANVSAFTRLYSIFGNVDIMRNNLLFGIGIDAQKDYLLNNFNLTASTNSILNMGAYFGILPFILYILLYINFSKNVPGKLISKSYIFLLMVTISSTESLIVSFMFYIILFYGSQNKSSLFNYGFNSLNAG